MNWLLRTISLAGLCLVLVASNTEPTFAQEASSPDAGVSVPAALGPKAMESLVSRLEPEQTEALVSLVELLSDSKDGNEVVQAIPDQSALQLVKTWFVGFKDAVVFHPMQLPLALSNSARALTAIFAGKSAGESFLFLLFLALSIAAGIVLEKGFNTLIATTREKIQNERQDTLGATLKTLTTRGFLDLGGLIVFAIAAIVAGRFLFTDAGDRFIATSFILNAILIARLSGTILRFVLAPHRSDLRLVYTDDWTARSLYSGFVKLAVLVGAAFFLFGLFAHFGYHGGDTLRFWASLIIHGWIIYITWKTRKGLTSIIKGDLDYLSPGLERMAKWWPQISIAVIAFNWFLIQFILSTGNRVLTPGRGAIAVMTIIILPFLDTIVRGVAGHLVPDLAGQGRTAEKAQKETRLCYVRMGRVILIAAVVLLIGKLWGLNYRNLAESGLGAQIASNGLGFLFILALGYMAWEITSLVINRKLSAELEASGVSEESEGGEGGGAGLTRMATVLPILRVTLQVTIIIITVLLALSQLKVNITPLLAGASVIGLAIGFGAQTLVKDIVSGVFFLLDDAFRAGEYIDVGGTEGTVEKISVRSLQLRGVTGPVHVVPYGSISKLTNMSRDWVIMKLKFTIPFDTDLEKVRKLFKKIGQEMMEVPELKDKFLAPFKGQGAVAVTDVGIVVRGKFSTKPGDQWQIRKEVYKRVQKAFEQNGIEFARREVGVIMPDDMDSHNLTESQKQAISTAASEAVQAADAEKAKQ
ncbi:MAG: mechanosensitive ion channel domain-containing protein [Arenicellales bacterium]